MDHIRIYKAQTQTNSPNSIFPTTKNTYLHNSVNITCFSSSPLETYALSVSKMSDNIPIEIQSEIMKRLPIKPLIQFRTVSKEWKSIIDSSMFINEHIQTQSQTQPQAHHVLLRYEIEDDPTCVSLRDDDSFPNERFNHTVPEFVNLLRNEVLVGSSHGLVCFYGSYLDMGSEIKIAVLWNPTVRKSVGIVVPNVVSMPLGNSFVGFGVCADTSDPKIVKINVFEMPSVHWEVEVFTLSSRSWKRLSINPPFELCHLKSTNIFIDGLIYWDGFHKPSLDDEPETHFIVSFDLKKEDFGEVVYLPSSLVHSDGLRFLKRNESLAVADYYIEAEDESLTCEVWRMKDGVTKSFTMMFSVKTPNGIVVHRELLGFRKNGEAIIERQFGDGDYDGQVGSVLEVYDPSSQQTDGMRIAGNANSFLLTSYIETILLLGESNSIIR